MTVVDFPSANGAAPVTDSWTPARLTSYKDRPFVQPTLGATGFVYPGKRHVFSGPPESAKTLIAYIVILQVIRHEGGVILIDFEMGGTDAYARLVELGATDDEVDRVHYIAPDEPANTDRIGLLISLEPSLIVVDAAAGAYNLEGLDDNKRGDVEKWTKTYVQPFWRQGVATIVIDHVVKDAELRGRFAIGSERKLGGADVHLGFETIQPISRGTEGRYKIVTHKDRGGCLKRGKLAEIHLSSDPDSHAIRWSFTAGETASEDDSWRPTRLMEKVSIWLEHQHEPATRNTIHAAMGGTKRYVLQAIDCLIADGYAVEHEGTHRARPVTSIRKYRETDVLAYATESEAIAENQEPNHRNHRNELPEQHTLVIPLNHPVVPVVPSGSPVVPEPDDSGGSGGSPYVVGNHPDHRSPTTQYGPGGSHWLDYLTWADTIAPEDDQ